MLIVSATGLTNVTVTLYELCSNQVNPYFTWNLERKGSFDSITFCATDISTAPWYWNEFQLTVATSSIGLTSGVIPLVEGEWIYSVYEMQNQYDLNINNSIGMVEQGIMVVGLTFSTVLNGIPIPTIPVFRGNR
jgi:hypothetical protein